MTQPIPLTPENCAEVFEEHFAELFQQKAVDVSLLKEAVARVRSQGGEARVALDLGAGHGRHALALLEAGLESVHCLEVSPSAVRALERLSDSHPGIVPISGDMFEYETHAPMEITGIYGMTLMMFEHDAKHEILRIVSESLHPHHGMGIIEWVSLDRARSFVSKYPCIERRVQGGRRFIQHQELLGDVWTSRYEMPHDPSFQYQEKTFPYATREDFLASLAAHGLEVAAEYKEPVSPRITSIVTKVSHA